MNSLPELLSLTRPHIDEETIALVGEVLRSGWLTTGPKCRKLSDTLCARAIAGRYAARPRRPLNLPCAWPACR